MAKQSKSNSGDYAVGFKRPPKASQFKPGQSGNSKGRPKGGRSVGAMLHELMQQKIAVADNGKTRRLSVLEVILRRLANDAMRGDQKAVKLLLALNDRYSGSPETSIRLDDLLAEDREILAFYTGGSAPPPESPAHPPSDEGARDAI